VQIPIVFTQTGENLIAGFSGIGDLHLRGNEANKRPVRRSRSNRVKGSRPSSGKDDEGEGTR